MKFRHQKYTYTPQPWGSKSHSWEIVGPKGAVSFHVNFYDDKDDTQPTCGLEFHHVEAGEEFAGQSPHHLNCPLTGGRCWHDGTSLYASESVWPQVKHYLTIGYHDEVFKVLQYEYKQRFEEKENDNE
jgi:hypothetical protein